MNTLSNEIKEFYDTKVPAEYGSDYERQRWFKNPVAEAGFYMTKSTVERVLSGKSFSSCFELGPGAGTWTKSICEKNPEVELTLLDISEKMLEMSKSSLAGKCSDVSFIRSDFLEFTPSNTYDFFFSSRAIEYVEDKPAAAQKISDLLSSGGSGAVITKYPRYWAAKLRGKNVPNIHQHQITPADFSKYLKQSGLTVTGVRPVILTFPFFNSSLLNKSLHALLGGLPLCFINKPFCESYVIEFTK